MDNIIKGLYEVVQERKVKPQEGSYTCYLFDKGIDKILKKVGEECAETIIAAKNRDNEELANEICDLLYHLMVMMVESNLPLEYVMHILDKRREKIGNLKVMRQTDKNT